MKKIVFLTMLMAPLLSYAQTLPEYHGGEANLEDLQIYLHNRNRSAAHPGTELKGSPFLFDDFRPADLYFTNKSWALNRQVKFDCYKDELIYLDNGIIYDIDKDIIDRFVIKSETDTTSLTFVNIFLSPGKKRTFLQILYEGSIVLYKNYHKEFYEADYTGPYNADRRFNEYTDKPWYYILMADGSMHKLRLNERYMTRLFSDRSEAIKEFIYSNNISLSEEKDLVRLAAFYDGQAVSSRHGGSPGK
jgi:hypothetical protein